MQFLERLFSVAGQTALVTGGATGIGRMIAEGLVAAGADVLIASRKQDACEAAAAAINAAGLPGKATGFAGDVATETGVIALSEAVAARTDRLDILVNNAGVSWGAPLGSFPHSAWAKVMDVNVAGLFTLTQTLLPLLSASASAAEPARIVHIGSVMGAAPIGDGAYSYAASKAAVHHLTRILAKELAGLHITVNAIAPGIFQSRMTAFATGTAEQATAVGDSVPLGRIGTPEDIAATVLFLCGRSGAYMTGAILPLDGGLGVQTGRGLFEEA